MVVQQQRCQYGRLRASVGPAEWQFSDRLSWYLCDYGEWCGGRKLPRGGVYPWFAVG